MKSLITVVSFFVATQFVAAQSKIALNLKAGQEYVSVQNSTIDMIQDFMGQEMKMTMHIGGKTVFVVKKQLKDAYIIDMFNDSMETSMEMEGKTQVMGSTHNADVAEEVMSKMFKAMRTIPQTITIGTDGKIIDMANSDSIIRLAMAKIEGVDADKKEMLEEQLKQRYGKDIVKSSLEQVFGFYPATKVSTGSKWFTSTEIHSTFSGKLNNKLELTGSDDKSHFITVESFMKTDSTKAMSTNGMDVFFNLSGTTKSFVKVDKTTGWINEVKSDINYSGVNKMVNEMLPDGMDIPMTMTGTTLVTGYRRK